ncbi:MAG: hypothetical protein IJK63_06595 [Oscillospiraceae bacterium]|nr:hypothetical protein [Oscillospiraceae bacterium]
MPNTKFQRNLAKAKVKKPPVSKVPEPNYISDLIKRYMKAQRLTTDDVGELMNCTGANIRAKLTRPIGKWAVSDIISLCRAVNCPVSEAYRLLPLD